MMQRHSSKNNAPDKEPINIASHDDMYGDLSNFAFTPFKLGGIEFASVEAFVQYIKYPNTLSSDEDIQLFAKHPAIHKTPDKYLEYVEHIPSLFGVKAKRAGGAANEIIASRGEHFVFWNGEKMPYRSEKHLGLIEKAIQTKFVQHPELRALLSWTTGHELKHVTSGAEGKLTSLSASDFIKILEEIRYQDRNQFFRSASF